MSIVVFYRNKDDRDLIDIIQEIFNNGPNNAVLVQLDADVKDTFGKKAPFVHIESTIDGNDENLTIFANRYNEVIDVAMRFSWGIMLERKKGQFFTKKALQKARQKFAAAEHSHV